MGMHLCHTVSEGQESRQSFPRCLTLKVSHRLRSHWGRVYSHIKSSVGENLFPSSIHNVLSKGIFLLVAGPVLGMYAF